MKSLWLFFGLYACSNTVGDTDTAVSEPSGEWPQTTTHDIAVDNRARNFIVYVPEAVQASAPIVFVMHGTGSSGQEFYEDTHWTRKADEEGFIAVFPSSLTYCYYDGGELKVKTKWAHGPLGLPDGFPLCAAEDIEGLTPEEQERIEDTVANDIVFFDDMVRFLRSNYSVDEKRLYITGNSNGASMTLRLAAERSEVLAAATANAGSLTMPFPAATRPLSVVLTIGTKDPFLAAIVDADEGEAIEVSEALISNPLLNASMHYHLDAQSLSDTYIYTEEIRQGTEVGTFTFADSTVGANNVFTFVVVEGRGHSYPNEFIDAYWNFLSSETIP